MSECGMDKKEMQEFLDLCVEDGKSELKSYRDFLKVLGLKFNGKKQEEETQQTE